MSRVSIAGRDIAFDCESHETVLDAAERAGFAIPYSCRKGVCSTCEGDVVSGTVMLGRTRIVSGPAQAVRLCLARLQGDIEIAPKSIAAVAPPLRKRFRASVHRIDNPAADVSILHLRLPIGRRAPFRAGQYVRVFLEDGESRNYSLANAPHDNDQVQLHVRHVPGGRFSEALLARLRPGDMLDLELPYGFFHLGEDSTRPLILLGTGTGFAPLRSIIEDLVRRRTLRPTHLFWGGRGRADLYEMTRPMRWAERHSWFRFTPVLSRPDEGWTGAVGRVQDAALRTYPDLSDAEVYACGNPAMVADARELLTTRGRLVADAFKADAFLPSGDAEEEQR